MSMKSMLCLTLAGVLAATTPVVAQQVIATGPIGGSWYPIGTGMVEVLKGDAGLNLTQTPGGGVSNVFAVGSGKALLAFSTAGAAASAAAGTHDFKGRAQKKLRLVGVLYPQEYTLVVWADSAIKTVADLRGKRVQTTARGSSTELMTRRVFGAHGLSESDVSTSYGNLSDGANQMKDGQTDAMSHLITHPTAHTQDLAASRPIRFIPLDADAIAKLEKDYPGYVESTLPGGVYAGADEPTTTIGEPVLLVTSADVDEETVYKMTKALFEAKDRLVAVHAVMKSFSPESAAKNPVVPIHSGALRYYKEAGVAP